MAFVEIVLILVCLLFIGLLVLEWINRKKLNAIQLLSEDRLNEADKIVARLEKINFADIQNKIQQVADTISDLRVENFLNGAETFCATKQICRDTPFGRICSPSISPCN